MKRLASHYSEQGRKPFIVPLGASSGTGSLGYAYSVQEMVKQFEKLEFEPDHIVVASGSGGTQAGLIIGKELFGISSQITGINVRCDEMYFYKEISRIFKEFCSQYGKINLKNSEINIIDGYVGKGYAKTRPEEIRFIAHLAKIEGLILDPTYTGKAMYGLSREVQKGTFKKGQKLLFVHTGGLFGIFPYGGQFYKEMYK
jgi:D-cysteine desulfhydrase